MIVRKIKKSILLIDDEESTMTVLRQKLETDFNISEASGWEDAKKFFIDNKKFDLVITDQVFQQQPIDDLSPAIIINLSFLGVVTIGSSNPFSFIDAVN